MIHCGSKSKRLTALVALVFVSHAVLSATSTRSSPGPEDGKGSMGLSFLQRSNFWNRRVCGTDSEPVCSLPLAPPFSAKHRLVTCEHYKKQLEMTKNDAKLQVGWRDHVGAELKYLSKYNKKLVACDPLVDIITGHSVYSNESEQPHRNNNKTVFNRRGCVFKLNGKGEWYGCHLRDPTVECKGVVLQTVLWNMLPFEAVDVSRRMTKTAKYDCMDFAKALSKLFPKIFEISRVTAEEMQWGKRTDTIPKGGAAVAPEQ